MAAPVGIGELRLSIRRTGEPNLSENGSACGVARGNRGEVDSAGSLLSMCADIVKARVRPRAVGGARRRAACTANGRKHEIQSSARDVEIDELLPVAFVDEPELVVGGDREAADRTCVIPGSP